MWYVCALVSRCARHRPISFTHSRTHTLMHTHTTRNEHYFWLRSIYSTLKSPLCFRSSFAFFFCFAKCDFAICIASFSSVSFKIDLYWHFDIGELAQIFWYTFRRSVYIVAVKLKSVRNSPNIHNKLDGVQVLGVTAMSVCVILCLCLCLHSNRIEKNIVQNKNTCPVPPTHHFPGDFIFVSYFVPRTNFKCIFRVCVWVCVLVFNFNVNTHIVVDQCRGTWKHIFFFRFVPFQRMESFLSLFLSPLSLSWFSFFHMRIVVITQSIWIMW